MRRHHLPSFALAALLVTALSTGCGEDEQAPPRVVLTSSVSVGSAGSERCPEAGTWFTIGDFGNPALGRENPDDPNSELISPVKPVEDGASDQQGVARVNCSVVPKDDAFDVRATAELSGATGGFFQLVGTFRPTGDQQDINVVLARRGQSYSQRNCVARYTSPLQTVATGRLWAEVECDAIENTSLDRECRATATFRFENCGQ